MPTQRPSFLKRQKELKRAARALEKREARRARTAAKAAGQEESAAPETPAEETGPKTE